MFTEFLRPGAVTQQTILDKKVENENKPIEHHPPSETKPIFPAKFLLAALEQSSDDAGWAQLGIFGSYLTKLQPDFDSRLYGFKKLSDLVKAKTDLFITEARPAPGSTLKCFISSSKAVI
ncbi:OST-HTH/LOTUS domain-containing protein [Aeromonas veronii]|uniref:OST-HTH/LOTUS domain-containing protein n=1 Tax=Aeromonas veronii TaxID=654 RepID=UPI00039C2A1B|nr:OST-HTH/LOTUS domain-containing protein [Aeromonas veronii]